MTMPQSLVSFWALRSFKMTRKGAKLKDFQKCTCNTNGAVATDQFICVVQFPGSSDDLAVEPITPAEFTHYLPWRSSVGNRAEVKKRRRLCTGNKEVCDPLPEKQRKMEKQVAKSQSSLPRFSAIRSC